MRNLIRYLQAERCPSAEIYLTDVIDKTARITQGQIRELLESQKHEELHNLLPRNWKTETDGADESATSRT